MALPMDNAQPLRAERPRREPSPALQATLEIDAVELWVRLGCAAPERAAPQEVRLGLTIRFAETPAGCCSDRLEDTVCYAELAEAAREHCAAREFRLIEHLAHELYALIRTRLPEAARLALTVTKVRPPVAELRGGVSFRLEERE